jgi:hypothetical protein
MLYPLVRDAELRANLWSFARKRVVLAADGNTPPFGTDDDEPDSPGAEGPTWADETAPFDTPQLYQYKLPNDFLRMIKTKYEQRRIEGNMVLTYEDSPINFQYICQPDPGLFDPQFVKALSCAMALELTEFVTTSTQKKQDIKQDYMQAIAEAKRVNAIEAPDMRTPEDSFVIVRR